MLNTLFLSSAAIICCFITYFILRRKINIFKYAITPYIGILFIPIFLIVYLFELLKLLVYDEFKLIMLILFFVIGINIIIIFAFMLLKMIFLPETWKERQSKILIKTQCIFDGNKIIKYPIYATLVYCIPMTAGLYLSVMLMIVFLHGFFSQYCCSLQYLFQL